MATLALQEQLHTFTPAKTADRTSITCQTISFHVRFTTPGDLRPASLLYSEYQTKNGHRCTWMNTDTTLCVKRGATQSNASLFRRPATVVRDRRCVADTANFETRRRQRAYSRFASRTRAAHAYFHRAETN